MKARTEQMLASKGLGDTRAQARLRRHPRHRVRRAAAATRARPARSVDPRPRDARRARAARGRRLRDDRRRSPPRRGVRVAAHGRAPAAARRRAPDPHVPADADARTHLARVLGFRDRRGASALDAVRRRAPAPPGDRARRSTRSCSSPRCSTRSPASARSRSPRPQERLTAFGFRDVEQTRAALRGADRGTHAPLARDAAAPAGDARLAVGRARPRPRPARAPPADRGLQPQLHAWPGASATPRSRPSARAACSARPASSAARCTGNPNSSTPSPTTRCSRPRSTRAELVDEALDSLDWREDDAGRRSGLRRYKRRHLLRIGARDVLGFAALEARGPRAVAAWPTRASKPRCTRSSPRCRSR